MQNRSVAMDALPNQSTAGGFLSEEREQGLLERYAANGDRDALSELLRAHLPLVARIARRHRAETVQHDDLLAEGMLGMLEAARRYDPSFGARFSSYAAHWARAYIRRYALAQRRIVVLPDTRASRRVLGRTGRTELQLASRLGRAPSDAEMAGAIGVATAAFIEVRAATHTRDLALVPRPPDEGPTWEPAEPRGGPEEVFAQAEERAVQTAELGRALALLPSRERAILERRFFTDEPPALQAIAVEMSISRERVRQLEARAIGRLRATMALAG
jgi:RNA polymerase sigma-32 factor